MSPKLTEKQRREPRFLPEFPITPGDRVVFITAEGFETGTFDGFDRKGLALIKWAERVTVQRIERHLLRPCNDAGMVAKRGFVRQPGYNLIGDEEAPSVTETVESMEPAENVPEPVEIDSPFASEPVSWADLSDSSRAALEGIATGTNGKIGPRTIGKLRKLGLITRETRELTDAGRELLVKADV